MNAPPLATERFVFHATAIADVWRVERKPIRDARGSFTRLFCADEFGEAMAGLQVAQINHSVSVQAGTVRGLHYQHAPHAEHKIVTCVAGSVMDVAVDIRPDSPTYLQHVAVRLDAQTLQALWIAPGCAHGFQTLEPHSAVMYAVSTPYNAQAEDGLNPFDPALGIVWPLVPTEVSARDRDRPCLPQGRVA
jgi:dTDP-4-dehydrorhamnose 3,5-epimerase